MKDCKKCFFYSKQNKKCVKFKCDVPDTKLYGSVCKEYLVIERKKVKCISCKNMNRYNYCLIKKICFAPEDKTKERYCRSYFEKKYKKRKEKY